MSARDRLAAIIPRVGGGRWIEEVVHHTPRELSDDLRAVLADLTEAERLLALVNAHDSNLIDHLTGWEGRKPTESDK